MVATSFYSEEEIAALGFAYVGKNVLISRKASLYSTEKICIGNNVRIDDFCILSGKIEIGSYVHISAYTALYGSDFGIILKDYTTISGRCLVYAESDDYSGNSLTNPMVDSKFRHPYGGKVVLEKYSIIGAGSTLLPAIRINEGAAIGAMSLVKHNIPAWTIQAGNPLKFIKNRNRNFFENFENGLSK